MAGQDVFKGALGWDDWIWWTGIGGVALFFLLTLLCCCVCVQRAKRKGRAEALAAVQARQREEQQREEAQVRYAQAQQARYPAPTPAQERDYKYSQQHGGSPAGMPAQMGPQGGVRKNYGPQVMANGGYAVPPPVPPQQYGQQYGQQQQPYGQQQQQYGQQYNQQQQGAYGQQQQQHQYGAVPAKQQSPPQNYYQQQQQQSYAAAPPPQRYSEEPPAKPAQNYTRKTTNKPKPWHAMATPDAPYTVDTSFSSSTHSEEANRSLHGGSGDVSDDVPFVAVTSPGARDPGLSASRIGVTLRDRVDALREGSVHENHTRISVDSQDLELPPIGAGRRSLVLMGTVLSEKSDDDDDAGHARHGDAAAFKTARSADSDYSSSSEFSSAVAASQAVSSGQFDDAETFRYHDNADSSRPATGRNRIRSDDSRVSVEF